MATSGSSGVTVVTGDVAAIPFTPVVADSTTGTATDRNDAYTVPAGKKWIVREIRFARAQAGSCSLNMDIDGTSVTVDQGITVTAFIYTNPFMLRAGDIVTMQFHAGTSGSLTSTIIYEKLTA